LNIDIHLY